MYYWYKMCRYVCIIWGLKNLKNPIWMYSCLLVMGESQDSATTRLDSDSVIFGRLGVRFHLRSQDSNSIWLEVETQSRLGNFSKSQNISKTGCKTWKTDKKNILFFLRKSFRGSFWLAQLDSGLLLKRRVKTRAPSESTFQDSDFTFSNMTHHYHLPIFVLQFTISMIIRYF